MLKEEELEKKRLAGVRPFKKRITQINDNDIPKKALKSNNDKNKLYELPVVCIYNYELFFIKFKIFQCSKIFLIFR